MPPPLFLKTRGQYLALALVGGGLIISFLLLFNVKATPSCTYYELIVKKLIPAKPLPIKGLLGVDLSRSAEAMTNKNVWEKIKESGVKVAVVQAWGGRTKNPHAETQLLAAHQSGLKIAAYTYLNFREKEQNGSFQVEQAIEAIGAARPYLAFMAVDVEPAFLGEESPADRVERITEAANAIREAGLQPIIYTLRYDWSIITGNSNKFINFPLWISVVERRFVAEDCQLHCGDGTPNFDDGDLNPVNQDALESGWNRPLGKQFDLGSALNCGGTTLHGVPVDLNVFDPALFP